MMEKPIIVIVEDGKRIAALLADYAKADGFDPVIFSRGEFVLNYIRQTRPAIMLLDIMLPGMDGMTVCKKVREISSLPIIMLTARVDEDDILLGLKIGADDYILKPFSPREVLARVNAVLRRSDDRPANMVRLGDTLLDHQTRQVFIRDRAMDLTPSEYGIISLMMENPQKIFSREELMEKAQGYEYSGYSRIVDTHIKNLRKKICKISQGYDPLVSVYGSGYRFDPGMPKDLDHDDGQPVQ